VNDLLDEFPLEQRRGDRFQEAGKLAADAVHPVVQLSALTHH
jgi:hypothetical protein